METLLNARGKCGTDRACDSWEQWHFFLNVSRQRAYDEDTDHQQNRTDKQQELRPAANGDEVERRVRAAEDQHLAEIFWREEGNEWQHRHHEQRHDVACAWNAPIGFSEVFVASRKNAGEADKKRNL